jgi:UDP-GlcNAc:undecaprenyl-phosphate GlcNAc-1-phosphate transferase
MQLTTLVAGFGGAATVAALATPLVRRIALRRGWVTPGGGRNVHVMPTPRVGGVAMLAAFIAALVGMGLLSHSVRGLVEGAPWRMVGLLGGSIAMFTLGLVDDLKGVRATFKLLAQVAVGVMAWRCGFRIDAIDLPVLGGLPMGIFSLPVTILWIAGIINAVNLIDGLDGLAGGVVFFAALTNLVVAYIAGSDLVAVWMVVLLGAVFGFLLFNFNPARIFMGDSGSYFLGFVLAVTSISGPYQKASFTVSVLAPLVALGVPIIDMLFAMLRRILERRSIFSPDRGHIHHRLLDMGITHRKSVLIIYTVCVLLTAGAIAIALGRDWEVGVAIVSVMAVMIGLVRFAGVFESLHARQRQRARMRMPETERLRAIILEVPSRLASARDEAAALEVLDWVRDRAGLAFVELLALDSGEGERLVRRFPQDQLARTPDVLTARFPLGEQRVARVDVKFGWRSESGDVPAATEILLQVVVDAVAARLPALGSAWVPTANKTLDDAGGAEALALTPAESQPSAGF